MTNLNTIVALGATLEAIEGGEELHLRILDASGGGPITSNWREFG